MGEVATVSGNRNSDYELPEHEQHLIHASIEAPLYSQQTGQKISTPRVQKFSENEFKHTKESRVFEGYEIEILHAPESFSNEGKAAKRSTAASSSEAPVFTEKQKLQARYTEVLGTEAPANLSIAKLKEAIDNALDTQE